LQWLSALENAQSDGDALALHLTRGAVNIPDFAWARQLNGNGMRPLIEQHGFIQAGYSLLDATVAARWQRKSSIRWGLTTTSTAMSLDLGANACAGWLCRWKMKRWSCC
jgi:hypothetical protein